MIKKIFKQLENSYFTKKLLSNNYFFNKSLNNSIVVLLYHEVSNNPSNFHYSNGLNVTPNVFYKQLNFLKKNFNIISPKNFLNKKFEGPSAMITFDDGAKGYFDNAIPILNELNLPSLHFLNMEPILGDINWNGLVSYLIEIDLDFKEYILNKKITFSNISISSVMEYLNKKNKNRILDKAKDFHGPWASVLDLEKNQDSKLIFFGNHLYNHYNATSLQEKDLIFQYQENKKYIIKYNNFIEYFSYPYGQPDLFYNDFTNRVIIELGAKKIFSANPINYNHKNIVSHRLPIFNNIESDNDIKKHILLPKYKNIIKSYL